MNRPLFAPFHAWLIRPEWAVRVVAGAYDAKTPEQRRAIVEENPFSYFGVTRSRGDLVNGDNVTDDDLLHLGATTLARILDAGAFAATDHRAFFAYRLDYGGHQQTGVVGALDVDALDDGRVLTHENVRPDRASLLARHLEVVGATSSPIALTHRADPAMTELVAAACGREPAVDHEIEQVRHRVWVLTAEETERLGDFLEDPTVYVTDGHHRAAAAIAAHTAHPDDAAFARTLGVVFPHDQLRVEAFHRRAPDRDSRTTDELVAALTTVGTVEAAADVVAATPTQRGEVGVYVAGSWFRLVLDPIERPSALASLDVERLRRDVLGHVLGVDELAERSDVDYVPGPTGVAEMVARCDADHKIGFVMYPTDINDLMAVAAAGELMPPKSSYFAPKPRSGVFLRVLGRGATAHLEPS